MLAGMLLCPRTSGAHFTDMAGPSPSPEPAATEPPLPRPDAASGIATDESHVARALLWIPRGLLWLPRRAFDLAVAPLRLGAYVYDRYNLPALFKDIFFNEAGTFGVYPSFFLETGFGLNAGVRMVHKDLFDQGERFKLSAGYGGRFRQRYTLRLGSGERLTPWVVAARLGYEIQPGAVFRGIGSGEEVPAGDVTVPIDPRTDDRSAATRFLQHVLRWEIVARVPLDAELSFEASHEWNLRRFERSPETDARRPDITDVYDARGLVGWDTGLLNFYNELGLVYDTLRVTHSHIPATTPSTGWRIRLFGGHARGVGDDPTAYLRGGLDVRRFFDLYRGDRVLLVRFLVESVGGDFDRIPFTDLPTLGGPTYLRGYVRSRFRDKRVVLGGADYWFPLADNIGGFLFVDAGQVWRDFDDFAGQSVRVGFGGGLQFYTRAAFLGRLQLASSRDGGFFIEFAFGHDYGDREPSR
jgi:hypothetical protein